MGKRPGRRDLAILCLVATTLFFCGCASNELATEGSPMPEKQVAAYIQPVTSSSSYDTPPRFLRGYAPFFPTREATTHHWGYAVVEFNVTADGRTSDVRPVLATAYSFAEKAVLAVQQWRFSPARKNGQPVVVRMRLPFTFRS